jgi:hypothetical protein
MHWHSQAPKSKANPCHDAPGNHAPALLCQLPRRGHPRHCATLCIMAGNNPVALCHPLLYGWRDATSKKDGGALEGETNDYSTLAQDCVMTSGQWRRPPLSPSALCDHPRHRDAILATASPSPTLWKCCWRKMYTWRQAHSKPNKLASHVQRITRRASQFFLKINKRQSS